MHTVRDLFRMHVAQTSDSPLQLEVEKAEGVYLFDPHGKKYIDLISGISVSNCGHCHPRIVDAINQQTNKYMHLMVYGEYIQYPQVRLAQKLANMLPANLQSCFFVNSGSEAVEGAMKLAKRFTGRSEIVAFNNAYHGSTQGSLSIMGNEDQKRNFRPLLPNISHIEFNSLKDIELITTKTACVIIEPVQGEAGVKTPKPGFLEQLRKKCDQTGALLVFDEIQTGMGRTGKMFAFERFGVTPDILLLAKALGGGMPIGAFISSGKIMNCLTNNPVLGHITTFGGHPVSCSAAIASIDVIDEEDLVKKVYEKELLIRSFFENHPKVNEVRSSGLLIAIELGSFEKVTKCIKLCLEKGVVIDWFLFCNTAIRIAPPLTITNTEIEVACKTICSALDCL